MGEVTGIPCCRFLWDVRQRRRCGTKAGVGAGRGVEALSEPGWRRARTSSSEGGIAPWRMVVVS